MISGNQMTKELLKCPFCGSDAELNPRWHGHVGCSNEQCGARHANLSIEQWNTRPAHEPLPSRPPEHVFYLNCPQCNRVGSVQSNLPFKLREWQCKCGEKITYTEQRLNDSHLKAEDGK